MQQTIYKPEQVAEYLGLTVSALAQLRFQGRGPQFIKAGRLVRYSETAIQEWLEQNTRTQT